MKIQYQGDTLTVSELKELGAANSHAFREEIRTALPATFKTIEIDFSQTGFLDSCGLGALIALYKTARSRVEGATIRLVNPSPPVQQIFELTRMNRIFEIVKR